MRGATGLIFLLGPIHAQARIEAQGRIEQERTNRDIRDAQLLLEAEERRKTGMAMFFLFPANVLLAKYPFTDLSWLSFAPHPLLSHQSWRASSWRARPLARV